jgi:hypothetical protein
MALCIIRSINATVSQTQSLGYLEVLESEGLEGQGGDGPGGGTGVVDQDVASLALRDLALSSDT